MKSLPGRGDANRADLVGVGALVEHPAEQGASVGRCAGVSGRTRMSSRSGAPDGSARLGSDGRTMSGSEVAQLRGPGGVVGAHHEGRPLQAHGPHVRRHFAGPTMSSQRPKTAPTTSARPTPMLARHRALARPRFRHRPVVQAAPAVALAAAGGGGLGRSRAPHGRRRGHRR